MNVKSLSLLYLGEIPKTMFFSDPVVCPSFREGKKVLSKTYNAKLESIHQEWQKKRET